MAGYLDAYGAGDERRARRFWWLIGGGLALLVGAVILYFAFRDYQQKQQLDAFLQLLRKQDYKAAYALWGCTPAKPCPQYTLESFLEDWGPKSSYANAASARIAATKSCEAGVIGLMDFPGQERAQLWVSRDDRTIGFAPWPLKESVPGAVGNLREFLWDLTRNCDMLVRK